MSRALSCLGGLALILTLALGQTALCAEKPSKPTKKEAQSAGQASAKAKPAKKDKEADAKKESDKKKSEKAEKKAAKEAKEAKESKEAEEPKPESEAKPETASEPQPAAPQGEKKPEKPPTFTITREPLKVELTLKGIFEAAEMVPISLRPKQWKELTVVEAVPHGREVQKGDVLVQLDLEKVDEQIADVRKDLELSDLSLKQMEETVQILQESTPLDLDMAERSKRIADEDLERFLKVDQPLYRKVADFMLKMSEENLEYEKEELRQLEKMYNADDLTEETEEIVVKRQRNTVAQAEFFVTMAKVRREEMVDFSLPRMEESETYSTRQQDLQFRRTKTSLPVMLKQQQLELAKKKVDRQRAQKRLEELVADREAMTVKAPADGIVYYGQYVRGQWNGATSTADDLRPGGNLSREKVFMTIVQDRPMAIHADVPEESLQYVRPGLKGAAEPTGYPDLKLSATVESVDAMPLGSQFAATITPSLPHEADVLMPGMSCSLKFVPYLKKNALVAPASAVFTDKIDSEKRYVYLYREGEKPEKQPVTVGKKSGDRVEILEGLDRGDEILLEEPKKDSKTKGD